jgi:hypothetical protein
MSRLYKAAITAALTAKLSAQPDPEGVVDLVASIGRIVVTPTQAEIKPALDRLKPLGGYRWIAINAGDLFSANPISMGSKVGILDETGRVLKAADLPRPK